MGHCLHQPLLMYHLPSYHGNTFIEQGQVRLVKHDIKPHNFH